MSDLSLVPAELRPLCSGLALSPDPVVLTDRHNRIVFWNRGAEEMLGYAAREALGRSCAALLEGCDLYGNRYCSESCPVTQIAARGETVRHFGLRLRAKDLRTVVVDVDILTFVIGPSDGYFLAHILKPSRRTEAGVRPEDAEEVPPRPTLVVAHESPDARARKLTAREVEVLGMLAAGHPTADIAARLHISTFTARNHTQNILDKLEVHSKAEAVAFAFQKHIL